MVGIELSYREPQKSCCQAKADDARETMGVREGEHGNKIPYCTVSRKQAQVYRRHERSTTGIYGFHASTEEKYTDCTAEAAPFRNKHTSTEGGRRKATSQFAAESSVSAPDGLLATRTADRGNHSAPAR